MNRFVRYLSASAALVLLFASGGEAQVQPRLEHGLAASAGLYAASGLGTNFFYGFRYDYLILGGRYFVEASIGVGSLESKTIATVSKAQLFATDKLLTYEFDFAYDAVPGGNIPFVLLGVAAVNQGGEASFAGVVGLGKRIPLAGLFGSNAFGLRYDVRDQIFSERVNNSDPFIAHNIVATLGFQVYF